MALPTIKLFGMSILSLFVYKHSTNSKTFFAMSENMLILLNVTLKCLVYKSIWI